MCSWAFAYISSLGCALKSEHLQNLQSSVYWQLSQWTVAFYFCNIFRDKERFSSEMTIPSSNLSFLNFRDPCRHIGSVFKMLIRGLYLIVIKYEPRKPVDFFPVFLWYWPCLSRNPTLRTSTSITPCFKSELSLTHFVYLMSTTQDNPNKCLKDCMRPSHYIKGIPKKN